MVARLLSTKLFSPLPRRTSVPRPRLKTILDLGAQAKLTLISAPAGFGKTTLLAEWLADIATKNGATAWISLDKTDSDPGTFWSYVIAALQGVMPGIGETILSALQSGQPPTDDVLADLVNELSTVPKAVHLILDDYHAIDHPEVHGGLAFLIEHLPAHVHMVISSRVDPPLPIARMRARGELVEVRSADLRFTGDETAAYFNDAMHLGLAQTDIATLDERTEGWIAALQLAALSMKGRSDVAAFVENFAGNDRYVFDYLVEEVLQRQPVEIRNFLLRTAFLDRLSGPLCDAVTESTNSRVVLDALDRDNLFLVPLDDRRQWFRYHHLFADVLQSHLAAEARGELPQLHRRASDWYGQSGEPLKAIDHALAGEDFERAAALIEPILPEMQRSRGEATLRRWAHMIPREIVRVRPVLGIGLVGGLVSYGEFDSIEDRLRDVETGLAAIAKAGKQGSSPPLTPAIIVDQTQLSRVPGAVELYRAALAQVRGDVEGLILHAKRVLEVAPADDYLARAAGSSMLGIAHWSNGELELAHRFWLEGRNGLRRIGHIADTLGVSIALADISLARGRLREAIQTYEQALDVAAAQGRQVLRGTADMHAGLSELYRECNDLEGARRQLGLSQELGERAGLPQHPYRWRVAAARLSQDAGDLDRAAELLDQAERLYVSDFFPNVRPVAAMRARVWIAQGRLDEGSGWARDRGLGPDDELSYLRSFEHITFARLLMARRDKAAGTFLDRLLTDATRGGRVGGVIEISVLQALNHGLSGDVAESLVALERALGLAEPEGYVRIFAEGGERMAALLKVAQKRGVAPVFVRKLLAVFGAAEPRISARGGLIEPLSDRELDVLRLLRTELGGPEIARELMVSVNTMRTHTKSIYEKLGVNSRRSAVRRAEELSLLARNRSQ